MGYEGGMTGTVGEGKGKMTALMQNYMALFNGLGLCKFLFFARISHETISRWIKGLTGWELGTKDLMEVGERLYNLKRAYNVMLGISSEDDTLPARIYQLLRPGQPLAEGKKLLLDMRRDYYAFRNWGEKGIPRKEKLIDLGLDEVVKKMTLL
ncbi:MAG: hypothetical protein NTY64_08320 [Deltaproteobacteria bacterium]|nr:hypothetical protein [Deltaproteobacteria bacterium]